MSAAPRRSRDLRRLVAPLAIGAAVAAASFSACADLGTDPDIAVALEFDGIPYPAVLAGDTLRDTMGVASPLRGVAFNGRGGVIVGAPITFLSLDTGVVIDGAGFLRTTRRSGTIRVLATIRGLQSDDRAIAVTRRPDTLIAPPATRLNFTYALPDVPTNLVPEMQVTLQSFDLAGGVPPAVTGWLVRWRVVHNGDTLSQADTSRVALQSPAGRRARLDTTKADGTSARRLRVFANTITPARDSFVVVAEVRRFGIPVRGSPVRFVVNVAPPTP